jgi:hypothetical protein
MFRKGRFFAGIVIAVLAIMTFVVPLASNAESGAAAGGNGHWNTVSMPTVFVTIVVGIFALGQGYSLFSIKQMDRRMAQMDITINNRIGEMDKRINDRLSEIDLRMHERFTLVEARFAEIDARFAQVDLRFAQVEERFTQLDNRLEARFAQVDARFTQVEERFTQLDNRLEALHK